MRKRRNGSSRKLIVPPVSLRVEEDGGMHEMLVDAVTVIDDVPIAEVDVVLETLTKTILGTRRLSRYHELVFLVGYRDGEPEIDEDEDVEDRSKQGTR